MPSMNLEPKEIELLNLPAILPENHAAKNRLNRKFYLVKKIAKQ